MGYKMIVITNDGSLNQTVCEMKHMEYGVLYEVVDTTHTGEILIRYDYNTVVNLTHPRQDKTWLNAYEVTLAVVRCRSSFSITLKQE